MRGSDLMSNLSAESPERHSAASPFSRYKPCVSPTVIPSCSSTEMVGRAGPIRSARIARSAGTTFRSPNRPAHPTAGATSCARSIGLATSQVPPAPSATSSLIGALEAATAKDFQSFWGGKGVEWNIPFVRRDGLDQPLRGPAEPNEPRAALLEPGERPVVMALAAA